MKRKIVECAVLLGVIMSVVFLAQTQEGVSHELLLPPHPDTGVVAPDPNHNDSKHPPCGVDEDWDPDNDPDPREFSDCGLGTGNSKGSKTSWALHYYGGKLSGTENMHPDGSWQCQMRYRLKVDVSVSADCTHCSASVTPSISPLPAVPVNEEPTFDGGAKVHLLISGVCFHDDAVHHFLGQWNPFCNRCWWGANLFTGAHCEWESRSKKELKIYGDDEEGVWIGIDVRPRTVSHTRSLSAGADFKATDNLNINVGYSTSTTSEDSGHVGLIYGIDVSIGGWELYNPRKGNAVIEKQDKSADVSTAYVEGASAQGIKAEYDGVDLHKCPPYDCPSGKCPPRM